MSTKTSFHHFRTEGYLTPSLIYHRVNHAVNDSIIHNKLHVLLTKVRIEVKRSVVERSFAAISPSTNVKEHIEVNNTIVDDWVREKPPVQIEIAGPV